jgi:hypothetical protein
VALWFGKLAIRVNIIEKFVEERRASRFGRLAWVVAGMLHVGPNAAP